ncbi:hypothetical protein [Sandaracinus amylolyticus]|uniref:DUF7919 family protein n=1 Tax=Sandaracinus amylolyticus TaxID=927083 RepID=UPI0012EDD7A3|nr:hypothetical protein [Sandaracinus amylolyticus]
MTWFEDLTPYSYFEIMPIGWSETGPPGSRPEHLFGHGGDERCTYSDPEVNVGWLDAAHPVPTARPSPRFVALLTTMCESDEHRLHQTRGHHGCPFCDLRSPVASAEIRVQGDGVVYAAPTLIAHYVAHHSYAPPQAFVDAVLRSDGAVAETGGKRVVPEELLRREPIDWRAVEAQVRSYRDWLPVAEIELELVHGGVHVRARVDCPRTPFAIDVVIPDWACMRTDQVAIGIASMIETRQQILRGIRFTSRR